MLTIVSSDPPALALGTSVLKAQPPPDRIANASAPLNSSHPDPAVVAEKQLNEQPIRPPTASADSRFVGTGTTTPSSSEDPEKHDDEQHTARCPPKERENGEPVQPSAPATAPTAPAPFSAFTRPQRTLIALAAAAAAMFSTLSSYIYYPAQTGVAADLGVSLALVQLTITSYLVVAGVAPAFMGDMADRGGRRPVYALMFALAVAANAGIALQRAYAALLVLRMVQSAGSSGAFFFFFFLFFDFFFFLLCASGLPI